MHRYKSKLNKKISIRLQTNNQKLITNIIKSPFKSKYAIYIILILKIIINYINWLKTMK